LKTKLQEEINKVLSHFPEYWENKELLKSKLIEDLRNYKAELIQSLLNNDLIKETYSLQIEDNTIFKLEDFVSLLRFKNYLPNSYTKYSNEIGLTSEGKYLQYNSDVVLDFPYKDTILEGGMTKEDVGKDEVFYHNVLAKEEIDTLFAPKVLSNVKKYDENGEHEVTEFKDTDNLIIKGNNLLTLHTLKKRYAGRIKLIYIDPPYNTGNDSFKYNDRFNHSTWLTFMKNRIEIAKDLLCDNGVIAIQTDYHESSYIRVLLDEIFGREAQISDIAVKMSTPSGPKMSHVDKRIPKLKDSIAIYTKGKIKIVEQPYKLKEVWDKEYSKILINFDYKDFTNLNNAIKKGNIEEINNLLKNVKLSTLAKEFPEYKKDQEWLKENAWRIVADKQNTGLDNLLAQLNKEYTQDIETTKSTMGNIVLFRTDKEFGKDTRVEIVFAVNNLKEHTGDLWTDISTSGGFSDEGGVNFPTAKKPEKLLKRIINMFTKKNDIVLDFFMGSSTTQAVAHKMNRQYIGIEQMDYINTISVPRLQKVIDGEQGGISKEVDWQGRGSFVYAELQELNQIYVDKIQQVSSKEDLPQVIDDMKEQALLDFKIDLEKVSIENEDFAGLSLEEQKALLINVLDENQLYLNYSEIDDSQYDVSEDVKQFNRSFYEGIDTHG